MPRKGTGSVGCKGSNGFAVAKVRNLGGNKCSRRADERKTQWRMKMDLIGNEFYREASMK